MAGTKAGGQKAAATNKKKQGADFYARIGRIGGAKARPESRYFYQHPDIAKQAGRKGGSISRRGPAKNH